MNVVTLVFAKSALTCFTCFGVHLVLGMFLDLCTHINLLHVFCVYASNGNLLFHTLMK